MNLASSQAIDYAAKNSAKVKNALLDYKIQEQSNRATTSQALPQVSGSAGLTDYFQIPQSVVPGYLFGQPQSKLVPIAFATQYSANAGITLKQVLFDGQVFVGLQARQTALDYYRTNQELTEQQFAPKHYKVYYQLLLSKVQVQLIDANIAHAAELLHNSSEMYKNGFAEHLDVDKATVQLTNLQSNRVQVLYNIDNGYLGLKVLMGMPVRDSLALSDSLTYEMVREGSLTDSYKYSDRKEYQALELNRKLDEFDVLRYKKTIYSNGLAHGQLSRDRIWNRIQRYLRRPMSWYPSSYCGLNLNIPIFDGFYKAANIRQARMQLQQTKNNLESLKNCIDNDVRKAQLQFSSALADPGLPEKEYGSRQEVYEQTRKKFEQGLGSNTEITTAFSD